MGVVELGLRRITLPPLLYAGSLKQYTTGPLVYSSPPPGCLCSISMYWKVLSPTRWYSLPAASLVSCALATYSTTRAHLLVR